MQAEKLIIIKTIAETLELIEYLKSKEFIAVDTETTGLLKDAQVIGISVSAEVNVGYYLILSYFDTTTQTLKNTEVLDVIKSFLFTLIGKSLIFHNAVFDCSKIKDNFGVDLMPSLHTDTMILAHLLDENRHNGLKELGVSFFGESAAEEQKIMKASVVANGGKLTKGCYELYKADADLIAKYGAKDTILTLKLFWLLTEQLFEQGLDPFFFEESMPLLKGPTYELNTTGLKVNQNKLDSTQGTIEVECMEALAFIHKETEAHTKEKYKMFNPNSGDQLAWLLYFKLGNEFHTLTETGREVCKALVLGVPYSPAAKREFIQAVLDNKDRVYKDAEFNKKTNKMSRPKKIGHPSKYLSTDAAALKKLAPKYKWVERLLHLNKEKKILSTYVIGIKERLQYGIIRPSFLQHGTTSGRYSSRDPNFQNLPRTDKRVKSFIVARQDKVFVGADYSQLEPRVFASISGDETLQKCFNEGKDFYSVVGAPVFGRTECTLYKGDPNSFAVKYPRERDDTKQFALATPYGTTAFQQSKKLNRSSAECQELIDKYFHAYPKVELMMLESHELAKTHGVVYSLFGRPRRIPEAMDIPRIYGLALHNELPYQARNVLNLAMNHRVQSTAASIMNRASIAFYDMIREAGILGCHIVLQVHDELVVECFKKDAEIVKEVLKECMENTTQLPGVKLLAEPKIGKSLAELK